MIRLKSRQFRKYAALAISVSAFIGLNSALSAKEMPTPVAAIAAPTVVADYPVGSVVSPVNQKSDVKVQKTNFASNDIKTSLLQTGVASYYGPGFHGRRTANGETFNQNAMTAAHRTLPFGTKLKVTNLANGQSTIVRVNDRGPYAGGRVLDLSVAAAKQIGSTHSGVAKVKIEVVSN